MIFWNDYCRICITKSVILNDKESVVYDDIHIQKWNVFENYFKAGNYLVTTDEGAFARLKYYELEISHE